MSLPVTSLIVFTIGHADLELTKIMFSATIDLNRDTSADRALAGYPAVALPPSGGVEHWPSRRSQVKLLLPSVLPLSEKSGLSFPS